MWKHVTLLLATALAFGVSLYLLQRAVGPGSPWVVVVLLLCFLGLARVAEPLGTLKVPAGLRAVRPWEMRAPVSRSVGVPQFGALLRNTPLRFLNTSVYLSRRHPDPLQVGHQLESAEASHFWAAVLLVPYLLYCAWSGRWAVLACFLAVQILGNVYPILHLRWVRGRLDRAHHRRTLPG